MADVGTAQDRLSISSVAPGASFDAPAGGDEEVKQPQPADEEVVDVEAHDVVEAVATPDALEKAKERERQANTHWQLQERGRDEPPRAEATVIAVGIGEGSLLRQQDENTNNNNTNNGSNGDDVSVVEFRGNADGVSMSRKHHLGEQAGVLMRKILIIFMAISLASLFEYTRLAEVIYALACILIGQLIPFVVPGRWLAWAMDVMSEIAGWSLLEAFVLAMAGAGLAAGLPLILVCIISSFYLIVADRCRRALCLCTVKRRDDNTVILQGGARHIASTNIPAVARPEHKEVGGICCGWLASMDDRLNAIEEFESDFAAYCVGFALYFTFAGRHTAEKEADSEWDFYTILYLLMLAGFCIGAMDVSPLWAETAVNVAADSFGVAIGYAVSDILNYVLLVGVYGYDEDDDDNDEYKDSDRYITIKFVGALVFSLVMIVFAATMIVSLKRAITQSQDDLQHMMRYGSRARRPHEGYERCCCCWCRRDRRACGLVRDCIREHGCFFGICQRCRRTDDPDVDPARRARNARLVSCTPLLYCSIVIATCSLRVTREQIAIARVRSRIHKKRILLFAVTVSVGLAWENATAAFFDSKEGSDVGYKILIVFVSLIAIVVAECRHKSRRQKARLAQDGVSAVAALNELDEDDEEENDVDVVRAYAASIHRLSQHERDSISFSEPDGSNGGDIANGDGHDASGEGIGGARSGSHSSGGAPSTQSALHAAVTTQQPRETSTDHHEGNVARTPPNDLCREWHSRATTGEQRRVVVEAPPPDSGPENELT